ncbi:heterokaryon incompatibility protein-domain-containing protein [Sordaria brevicollis]|uniref:Heterokaryon incompatibility protein-domain-containing protein n=1 Tax=Sordaria brevicollis TaxID=83679 RepID=A0AAE0P324_SORBR|nr:heterokaryon incompatibility protein-domain-containing protein [Sordaria brevicollis]
MAQYQLVDNVPDLSRSPWSPSWSPKIWTPSQPAPSINRPALVPANVLCSRCSRIVNKSKLISVLLSGDKEQIRKEAQVDFTAEVFFHSRTIRDIVLSAFEGCHICSIISTSEEIYPGDLDRNGSQTGVIQARLKFEAYDEENDEDRLYLCIEDHTSFRIPNEAAEDLEVLDSMLQEDLDIHDRWAAQIDYLRILPIKEKDFLYFQSGPPETDFIPSSTNSRQTFKVIQRWMDDCLRNHPECNENFLTNSKTSTGEKLPTRLISVEEDADGQLAPRLVLPRSSAPGVEFRYLTLSHSWAVTGKSAMLTIANMERFLQQGIPLEELSQTFRDALLITRELGFQYIWIDSLCIIQDSEEDWEKEALTMSDVYGHSSCNISACGGLGIDGCFASRDPLQLFPCRIRQDSQVSDDACAYVFKDEWPPSVRLVDRDTTPLLARGWCVQERLLSARVVYFGADEVFWECCRHVVKESSPPKRWMKDLVSENAPWVSQKARFQELCNLEHAAGDMKAPSRGLELGWVPPHKVKTVEPSILRLYLCWYRIVSDYSFANLTRTTDRLMALAGIAGAIENSRDWTYLAGTWKEFWPLDLLWCFTADDVRRMDSGIQAPSWSWAAKEGRKSFLISVMFNWHSFENSTVTYMSRVVNYFCPSTLSKHRIGSVAAGEPGMTITLKGPVRRGFVGSDLGCFQPEWERRVQLDDRYGFGDSVRVKWDEVPEAGEPVLLLLVVTWEEYELSFQHVGLVLMPERCQSATSGTSGTMYKRVGAWIAHRAERNPQSVFFHGTEAEETVTIC